MMHRPYPVGPGERFALGVGDRNQRHVPEFFVEWDQVWEVKPSMKRAHARNPFAPAQRKVNVVDVKVYEVELFRLFIDPFHHQNVRGQRVNAVRIQS
jgi:hypothetical protein